MTEISDDNPGLFGWVPAPARGMGRPSFVWSREKSNRVMVLFAAGYKQRQVAEVLGCDVKTLRKTFSRECRHQARAELILRSGIMVTLIAQAEAGNVGAAKQLERMIDAEKVRVTAVQVIANRQEAAQPKAEALGKKETAKKNAKELGGRFATRTPPPSLSLN